MAQTFFEDYRADNLSIKNIEGILELMQSHRILKTITIYKVRDKDKISFDLTGTIIPYSKGLICGCLPIPGKLKIKDGCKSEACKKPKDWSEVGKSPEIVVKSRNVVEALQALSQVWQDSFAKSVLISAPPGSGKEQFSKSIPYGTGRVSPLDDVISLSLAGDEKHLEKMLYGTLEKHRFLPNKLSKGLIDKAGNSVLFLDEAHYPEEGFGIRASLLRPLESDEYYPVGDINPGDEPQKVDKVLFVLATSKPMKSKKDIKGLADIKPVDFWTRMTHVIKIKHPFESVWDVPMSTLIQYYFKFFWWERLESFFKIDPETDEDLLGKGGLDKELRLHSVGKLKPKSKIREKNMLDELAELFQRKLLNILSEERIQPHELSIRGFRNIVTRIFSISAERVTEGHNFDIEYIGKEIDGIIYEILEIAKLDS